MIEFNGKELGFRRTVFANAKIAELLPGRNLQRFGEVFETGDYIKQQEFMVQFILAMNEGYEQAKRLNDPNYTPAPITKDELLYGADFDELTRIFLAAADVFNGDAATTVKTVPKPGKKTVKTTRPK